MSDQIRCFGCGFQKLISEVTCLRCLTTCKSELANLPKLHLLASAFLAPGKTSRGSSSNEMTIGISVKALDYRVFDVLDGLHYWQDKVRDQLELHHRLTLRGSLEARVKNAVEFLQVHFEFIAHNPDFANDFISDIRVLYNTGLSITGQTQPKTTQISCPGDWREKVCYSKLTIDESDLNAVVQCRRCKTNWTTSWLIQVALSAPNASVWLDAESIGQYKNLSASQVRRIAKTNDVPKEGFLYHLPKFLAAYEKSVLRIRS